MHYFKRKLQYRLLSTKARQLSASPSFWPVLSLTRPKRRPWPLLAPRQTVTNNSGRILHDSYAEMGVRTVIIHSNTWRLIIAAKDRKPGGCSRQRDQWRMTPVWAVHPDSLGAFALSRGQCPHPLCSHSFVAPITGS